MPIIAVALMLYFTYDISQLNERIGTTFPNQPSWVFEIEGGDSETLQRLASEYQNLMKVTDRITGNVELVDVNEGHSGQYQDVSPFLVFLIQSMGYTPDPRNPPPNTADYKEGQVLKWTLTKSA